MAEYSFPTVPVSAAPPSFDVGNREGTRLSRSAGAGGDLIGHERAGRDIRRGGKGWPIARPQRQRRKKAAPNSRRAGAALFWTQVGPNQRCISQRLSC